MAISMSGIKSTLGSSSNSLRAYSAQAGFTVPDRMSEFTGYTPPTPPPPAPTVYQITECGGSRTEYITLSGSSIAVSVGRVYKFSSPALPGCWLVQNTGGTVTFSSVTATNEYADCATCNPPPPPPTPAPTPPTPPPTPPTPPPTPPPPATYSFILAYSSVDGPTACANRNTNTNMGTKWSLSSSIGSGVYLYNSQAGAETSNSGDYVANGWYSNGTNY